MNTINIPDKKYFTIGEVSRLTGIKPFVLRYWESEFKLLRPVRRESGQRRYLHKDIELIATIKSLLYERRFSIAGAKIKLKEHNKKIDKQSELFEKDSAAISLIKEIKKEITGILKTLE